MSALPPASPGLLEKVSRGFPRVLLGLFVLWQTVFLVVINLLDMKEETHEYFTKARASYYKNVTEEATFLGFRVLSGGLAPEELFEKSSPESSLTWRAIRLSPKVERAFVEWLDAPKEKARDKTTIGAAYVWVNKRATWWARKAKQEQGWCLFAPYVADWTCFPSLELVWEGGKGARPESVTLLSDNEPRDHHHFVKFGHFRLRRYENLMDVEPIHIDKDGAELTPEQKDDLGERMVTRVRNNGDNILAYMSWRVLRYQEEHPGIPKPTTVILHTRGWIIRPPPEDRPWKGRFPGWRFTGDFPVARSQLQPNDKYGPLEVYVPRHGYFKKLDK